MTHLSLTRLILAYTISLGFLTLCEAAGPCPVVKYQRPYDSHKTYGACAPYVKIDCSAPHVTQKGVAPFSKACGEAPFLTQKGVAPYKKACGSTTYVLQSGQAPYNLTKGFAPAIVVECSAKSPVHNPRKCSSH